MKIIEAKSKIRLKRPAVLFALIFAFSAYFCAKGAFFVPLFLSIVSCIASAVASFLSKKRFVAILLFAAFFLFYPVIYLSTSRFFAEKIFVDNVSDTKAQAIVFDKTEYGDKTVLYAVSDGQKFAVVYDGNIYCDLYDEIFVEGYAFDFFDEENATFYTKDLPKKETALSKGCLFGIYANNIQNYGRIDAEKRSLSHNFHFYLKDNMKKGFDHFLSTDTFSIATALLTGDRSYLSSSVNENFKRSGLIALLCISGLHVVISSTFLVYILKLLKAKKSVQTIILLLFLGYVATVTGFRGAILRACIMSGIFYLSRLFEKHKDPFSVLSVAFIVISLLDPFSVFDLSTVLSFLAMAGIVFSSVCHDGFFEDREAVFYKIKRQILSGIYATCFAAIPIVEMFGGISVISPISNLFASVIFAPLMFLLVACAILCFLPPPIFSILAFIPQFLIFLLERTARFFASVPYTYTEFSLPNFIVAAFGVFFIVFLLSAGFLKNKAVMISGYASFMLSNILVLALFVLSYL